MKLRFSIRDLFWFVLVVAMAAAWWLDRQSWVARYGHYTMAKVPFKDKQSGDTTLNDCLQDNEAGLLWIRVGNWWYSDMVWPSIQKFLNGLAHK